VQHWESLLDQILEDIVHGVVDMLAIDIDDCLEGHERIVASGVTAKQRAIGVTLAGRIVQC
jgi:hypothetical protein